MVLFSSTLDKFTLQCPYCGQFGFPSAGALTQHTQRSAPCKAAMLASVGVESGYTTAQEFPPCGNIMMSKIRRGAPQNDPNNDNIDPNNDNSDIDNDDNGDPNPAPQVEQRPVPQMLQPRQANGDFHLYETAREDQTDDEVDPDDLESLSSMEANNNNSMDDNNLMDDNNDDPMEANENPTDDEDEQARLEYLESVYHSVQNDLDEYREKAKLFHPFTMKQKTALNLMYVLRQRATSLDTYEAVMAWHLQSKGLLAEGESVTNSPHFISRECLFKFLRERYNMEHGYNKVSKIVLPYSKTKATMVLNA